MNSHMHNNCCFFLIQNYRVMKRLFHIGIMQLDAVNCECYWGISKEQATWTVILVTTWNEGGVNCYNPLKIQVGEWERIRENISNTSNSPSKYLYFKCFHISWPQVFVKILVNFLRPNDVTWTVILVTTWNEDSVNCYNPLNTQVGEWERIRENIYHTSNSPSKYLHFKCVHISWPLPTEVYKKIGF
jgi:hypothetical protein